MKFSLGVVFSSVMISGLTGMSSFKASGFGGIILLIIGLALIALSVIFSLKNKK